QLLRGGAQARAEGRTTPNTSVILLFLDGGAPQHETFDPKPDAPREYRSLFGTVQTRLPGVRFGSHFPRLAQAVDRMSVIRSLVHDDGDHGGGTPWMKTSKPWPPPFRGQAAVIPQQSPSVGAVVARVRGAVHPTSGVPTHVRVLSNHGGYPGDDAVWLGQAYSPFRVGRARANQMLANM